MYAMKRTSLFLDEGLLRGLRQAARRRGTSVAALVREAVALYLAAPGPSSGALPSVAGRFASGLPDTAERSEDLLWRDPHA
jgi:hypothetical protein